MTREEAIKVLSESIHDGSKVPWDKTVEAVHLSIEALSQPSLPSDLDEAAGLYAEKHGFRVPYDGSNNFYDDVDVKASKEGFIAGAKWDRAKMMEKAVEGRIGQMVFHNSIYVKEPEWCDTLDKFNNGDKVKVIVIPEEDEK